MNDGDSMTVTIDKETLEEAKKIVDSEKFAHFLMNNTADFTAAAYIMQVIIDTINKDLKLMS